MTGGNIADIELSQQAREISDMAVQTVRLFMDGLFAIMSGTMTRRPAAVSGFTNFRYRNPQAGLPCRRTMGSPKHAKRHTYAPSKPFGAWVLAIARYKWIDRVRDASRYAALSLDDDIPIEDQGGAAVNAVTLDHLLGRLKPAQESVIRLVKLRGLNVAHASGATGQSVPLVKVNIHRGLKKLIALVS